MSHRFCFPDVIRVPKFPFSIYNSICVPLDFGAAISTSFDCFSNIAIRRPLGSPVARSAASVTRAPLLLLLLLLYRLCSCTDAVCTACYAAVLLYAACNVAYTWCTTQGLGRFFAVFCRFSWFRGSWCRLRRSPADTRSIALSNARRRSRDAARTVIRWRPWIAFINRPPPPTRSFSRSFVLYSRRSAAHSIAHRR